jgi:hypothetical protein
MRSLSLVHAGTGIVNRARDKGSRSDLQSALANVLFSRASLLRR